MTSVLSQSATIINTWLPDSVDFDEIVGVGLESNKFNDFYTGLHVVLIRCFSTLELDFVVVDIFVTKIGGNYFNLNFLVCDNWELHVFGLVGTLFRGYNIYLGKIPKRLNLKIEGGRKKINP